MNAPPFGNYLLLLCLMTVVGFLVYSVLYAPDKRSAGDKMGDAMTELPNGINKAARQFENRTPADKINDAAKDAGAAFKKATNQQ